MDDTLCAERANREKELVCLEEMELIKATHSEWAAPIMSVRIVEITREQ